MEYSAYKAYINNVFNRSFLNEYELQPLFKEFRNRNELLKTIPTHTAFLSMFYAVKAYELFFKCKSIGIEKPILFKNSFDLYSSFHPRYDSDTFYFENNLLHIEGLPNKFMKTGLYTGSHKSDNIKYIDPTIIRNNRTGKFTLSFVTIKDKLFIDNSEFNPIGVDINKRIMYACSNGLMIPGPDISRLEIHLADINNDILNDRNRLKENKIFTPSANLSNSALFRLNKRKKIYEKITNLNKDAAYKGSLEIIKCKPSVIIIEDLNLKLLKSDHYVADDIQNHPLGIYLKILQEQCFKYNIPVIKAPRELKSSSICSNCGYEKDIHSSREFICNNCGLRIDRDLNAAINLKNWYLNNYCINI